MKQSKNQAGCSSEFYYEYASDTALFSLTKSFSWCDGDKAAGTWHNF